MPIIVTTLRIPLADGWELHVVNSGPHAEVLLAFNSGEDCPVRERLTVHLTQHQSVQLARALAGITSMMGHSSTVRPDAYESLDDDDKDDDNSWEEDTVP